jgi:hypothetical protein
MIPCTAFADHLFDREGSAMPDPGFSRREWLERVSGPALGGALIGGPARGQTTPRRDSLDGARVYNIRDFGGHRRPYHE